MSEVPHQPCPYPVCSSSDAFCYNTEKMTGHCKSCNRGYPSREKTYDWAEEEYPTKGFVPKNIIEVDELPVFDEENTHGNTGQSGSYVGSRSITNTVMEFYGVKTYGNDRQEYIYPSGGIKVRRFPKEFYAKAGFKGNELFGMNLFPAGSSKMVTVVEGELDALSAYQMLSDGRYTNPVVSLPSASPSGKLWESCKGWLDSFEKIILSVDNDEPGRKVAEVMFDLFPGKVHMMNHGQFKDANDFLQAGKQREYKSAWWAAKKYSPAGFTSGAEDWLKAVRDETPYEYTETPVEALNKVMRGWIKGGITVVKAPPGVGKCLGGDVEVMLADGHTKKARDIIVGDYLMGDDGTPRTVLSTTSGQDEMFKITPIKGEPWVCNSVHVLSLYHNGKGEVIDIPLNNYLKAGNDFKHRAKQYRVPVEDFGPIEWDGLFMAPYSYGVFLGDGSKSRSECSLGVKKDAVRGRFVREVKHSGFNTEEVWDSRNNCWTVKITMRKREWYGNPFRKFDTSLVDLYKRDLPWVRKQFLAGILDTDGSLTNGTYEVTQKDKRVSEAVAFAARSLGLAAYVKEKVVNDTSYWRVNISGDIDMIPCLRHEPKPRKQIKDVLRTGFSVESLGQGTYHGFEIDGNKRFLLGDFTVTHNTSLFRYVQHDLVKNKGKIVANLAMEEMKSTTARGMATYELGCNVNTEEDQSNNGIDDDKFEEALLSVVGEERFISFDIDPHDPLESTLKQCKHALTIYGVDYIFIDHFQRLAYLSGVDGATSALTELGVKLVELAKRRNVGIIGISHVNNDGHTKYAKSIEEEAIVLLELQRDKLAEDADDKNTTHLTVTKNRPFANTGPAGMLRYDVDTTMVEEYTGPAEPKTPEKEEGMPF